MATLICSVCGREYQGCRDFRASGFRWQNVACSPECGEKYLQSVFGNNEEATPAPEEPVKKASKKRAKVVPVDVVVDTQEMELNESSILSEDKEDSENISE